MMTRGRYYATVMPIAGILYAIALIVAPRHSEGTVAVVGALVFALLAVAGTAFVGRAGGS